MKEALYGYCPRPEDDTRRSEFVLVYRTKRSVGSTRNCDVYAMAAQMPMTFSLPVAVLVAP